MKILLIGHRGYIGTGLFGYLNAQHKVIGWGRKENILSLNASILKELNIEAVINCATITDRINRDFVIDSESDRVNIGGVRTLVSALKGQNIKLIHISTKDVFGRVYSPADVEEKKYCYRPKFLVDDTQSFAPETVYAKTKLISEFIVESHPQTVVIRLSSCYTDFNHHRGNWIIDIAKALLQGKPVTVTNNGKQFRDLLHVNDLGRLIDCILKSDHFGVRVNAGGGSANIHSILQVIRMLEPNAKVIRTPGNDYGFAFNNRLATEIFGWRPQILFAEQIPIVRNNIIKGKCSDI